MTDAEIRAMQLYPPKYIRETWKREDPDINAPLRAAYVRGFQECLHEQTLDALKAEMYL